MFKVDNEAELRAAFRPKDRASLELPPGATFPMIVRGYSAWLHPAGGRVFLLFAVPGGVPTGVVFEGGGGGGPHVPHMCDWCHAVGPGAHAGMLTAQVNAKKRVGVHVCTDLSCKQKIEEEADRTGRNAQPLIDKLVERMGTFARDALGIDLTGANR